MIYCIFKKHFVIFGVVRLTKIFLIKNKFI